MVLCYDRQPLSECMLMEENVATVKAEIERLWKQLYNIGAMLQTTAEQYRAARETNRKLEAQVQGLSEQLKYYEHQQEEISHLRSALQSAEDRLRQANEAIALLEQQRQQLEQVLNAQQLEFESYEQLRSELTTLQQLYGQLTEDYRAVQQQVAQVETLEKENLQLRDIIAQYEHEHLRAVAQQEELDYLRQLVEQLRREKEDLAGQLAAEKETQQLLQQKIVQGEALRLELEKANATVADLRTQLRQKETEIAQLRQHVDYAEQVLANSLPNEMFEQWKRQLQQELESSAAHAAELAEQLHRVGAERDDLLETLKQKQTELEQLQSQYDTLRKQYDELVQSHSQINSNDSSEREQVSKLLQQLELSEKAAQQHQQRLVELTKEIANLQSLVAQYQQQQQSIEQQIADALSPFQIKLEAAERERKHLQEQILHQRQRIVQLEDELRKELERNILLKRRIRQLEGFPSSVQITQVLEAIRHLHEQLVANVHSDQEGGYSSVSPELREVIAQVTQLVNHRLNLVFEEDLRRAVTECRCLLEEYLRR